MSRQFFSSLLILFAVACSTQPSGDTLATYDSDQITKDDLTAFMKSPARPKLRDEAQLEKSQIITQLLRRLATMKILAAEYENPKQDEAQPQLLFLNPETRALLKYYVDTVGKITVEVSDEEARAHYEELKPTRFTLPEKAKIQYIFLRKDRHNSREMDRLIRNIERDIEKGRPFEELVSKYSESATKNKQGILGPFFRGKLDPEFERRLFDRSSTKKPFVFMDDCVGTVVRGLRRHHLENDTGMILVADHGEGLGDHGEETHALLTFNSTLHVPLIMDFPWRQQAGKISQYVSTVDITPTVVDAFDLALPKNAHPFQGESLVPWLDGRGGHEERSLYFECFFPFYHYDWYPLTGMMKGHYKLIEAPEPAIYDLKTDPHEEHKITNPEMLAEFRQDLVHLRSEIEKGHPEDDTADLDAESFKQLEALGYVGSAIVKDPAQLSQHELATLPDPQNSLGIWQDNNMAMAAAREQHWDEAIQSCRMVLDTQPGNRGALLLLAQARSIMGNFDGADRLYREILSRFADPETLQQAARYYLLLRDDPNSALSCLDALLAQWPDDANTLILKAQAEAKMGDLGQAETLLRRVVEADPKSRDGLLHLAQLLHGRLNRAEEAGKLFRQAVEFYPFDPKAQFDLGVFLLKTGKPDEALRHFSQASTFAPGGVFDQAHLAMALIYRDQGKLTKARRRLHELLLATKNPELHRRAKTILDELSAGN